MKGRKPSEIIGGSSPIETVPRPPAWLSRDAKAEWQRVAPIMIEERRVLTVPDMAQLANYCCAIGEVAEASRLIAKEGIVFRSPSGPKKHPAVAIRTEAMTQARRLAAELGLTPMSRSRAPMKGKSDDDAWTGMDI